MKALNWQTKPGPRTASRTVAWRSWTASPAITAFIRPSAPAKVEKFLRNLKISVDKKQILKIVSNNRLGSNVIRTLQAVTSNTFDNNDSFNKIFREKKNMFLPDSQVVATGCYLDLEPERSREEDDLDRQGDRDLQILSTWGKFHSKNSWENLILFWLTHYTGFAAIFRFGWNIVDRWYFLFFWIFVTFVTPTTKIVFW